MCIHKMSLNFKIVSQLLDDYCRLLNTLKRTDHSVVRMPRVELLFVQAEKIEKKIETRIVYDHLRI